LALSELEFVAVAFGLANIGLLIRKSVWNFPAGIVMVTLYAGIFFETRLYSEALLQLFFLCVQVFGWRKWLLAIADEGEVMVFWSSPKEIGICLGITGVVAVVLGTALATWTNAAAPYPDATVAAASVVAQFLLSYRRIENWVYWIAIDCLSIGLYVWRGLTLTAGLYVVMLIMSIIGLGAWLTNRSPERV
jgi:nicotinamide mononucleotide transporter